MSYVLPQVLVFQEFAEQPVSVSQELRACVVGEHFDLHRFTNADEKPGVNVGEYDPVSDTPYAWPARQAGAVVDETYTKVFLDDALLKYFNDPVGNADLVETVVGYKNRVRSPTIIWKTANDFDRAAALLRDVTIGDAIKLVGTGCDTPATFRSTILSLVADRIAAIVAAADSDSDNQTTTAAGTSQTQTAGEVNDVEIASLDGSLYDGLADGAPSEIYTLEVIQEGGTGVAVFKVTSQSGLDDQASLQFSVAFGAPLAVGTRGLTITFDLGVPVGPNDGKFLVGQKWRATVSQTFAPGVPTSGGSYSGPSDTTYIVEVSRGGKYASLVKPQVRITTSTGIDVSGPTTVSAAATDVAVGTKGVLIQFSGAALCKGDRYTIAVTAEADGAVKTLVLADNIPDTLRGECGASSSSSSSLGGLSGVDLDITLYMVRDAFELTEIQEGLFPNTNWEQSETEITVKADAVVFDDEWQDGGVRQALSLAGGTLFIHHRDRLPTWCETVGTIDDVSLVADVLGKVDKDNPLAFGVYNALLNANGEEVKFLGVCSSSPVTLENWLNALSVLVGRDDVYSLVPLTQEKAVHDAFLAHANAESTPETGRWRICWFNRAAEQTVGVYLAADADPLDPVLATIQDDTGTSGVQYTIVEAAGEKFVTNGVRAGDVVRALYTVDGFGDPTYSEFVVDEVTNEETIRLVSGPDAAVNTPSKIEIWRTLSKTELATALATYPGAYASRRARLVWPDVVGNAGETFPGYFLCAAYAGLRSGVLPHQGLTNVELIGFDDLARTDLFNASQLNVMAASGYWITVKDPQTGAVFARHELTTGDQDNILHKEDMLVTNPDHVSYVLLRNFKDLIGRGNATPTMVDIIRGRLLGILDQFKNTVLVDRLGPQLIDATITRLRPHPTLKDRIEVIINAVFPAPLNNLEIHLRIS